MAEANCLHGENLSLPLGFPSFVNRLTLHIELVYRRLNLFKLKGKNIKDLFWLVTIATQRYTEDFFSKNAASKIGWLLLWVHKYLNNNRVD